MSTLKEVFEREIRCSRIGLSGGNLHLRGQITDFESRDYICKIGHSRFIEPDECRLPNGVLQVFTSKYYNPDLPHYEISEEEAEFFAEYCAIIQKELEPSPIELLRDYAIKEFQARDHRSGYFPHVSRLIDIYQSSADEVVEFCKKMDPAIFMRQYLAEKVFEKRERNILQRFAEECICGIERRPYSCKSTWLKSGFLILKLEDCKEYITCKKNILGHFVFTVNARDLYIRDRSRNTPASDSDYWSQYSSLNSLIRDRAKIAANPTIYPDKSPLKGLGYYYEIEEEYAKDYIVY